MSEAVDGIKRWARSVSSLTSGWTNEETGEVVPSYHDLAIKAANATADYRNLKAKREHAAKLRGESAAGALITASADDEVQNALIDRLTNEAEVDARTKEIIAAKEALSGWEAILQKELAEDRIEAKYAP